MSKVSLKDQISGLRKVRVTSAGSHMDHTNLVIGLRRKTHEVSVWTECCYEGVELTATDVAGNTAKCVAGVNPNKAATLNRKSDIVFMISAVIMIFYRLLL